MEFDAHVSYITDNRDLVDGQLAHHKLDLPVSSCRHHPKLGTARTEKNLSGYGQLSRASSEPDAIFQIP